MSAKHTPGPWYVEPALVGGQIPVGPNHLHRVAMVNGRAGEQEANAAIIAAAPDLLEALRALAEGHEDGGFVEPNAELMAQVRAAIAKAEGRS